MKFAWIGTAAFCLVSASSAMAENFAECIINRMQGASTAAVSSTVTRMCNQAHPDGYFTIARGSGRGLFGPKSGDECTIQKAKGTPFQPAAAQMAFACRCLFDKPSYPMDMCARYALPEHIRSQHPAANIKDSIILEHHYRRIYAAHPDADNIFSSEHFQKWYLADKARVDVLLGEKAGTTQDVIDLFSKYKREAYRN